MSQLARISAVGAALVMASACGGWDSGIGETPGSTTSSVSGTVSGLVASGVTIVLSGAASATATTSGTGAYRFTGLANGGYTLTPSLAGHAFSPASISVTVRGASVSGKDFTAVACSLPGNVTIGSESDWKAMVDSGCTEISGDLRIVASGLVGSLSAPSIKSIGGSLLVALNTALTSLGLPALTTVGNFLFLGSNPTLTSFSLPLLTRVGGKLNVHNNAALTSLSLPALTTLPSELVFADNDALTSFSLPALTTVGGSQLIVSGNPALPECLALAFKDHLVAAHGYAGIWTVSGNDTTATCP